jgi:8-oxo-dGTP diphosphatase
LAHFASAPLKKRADVGGRTRTANRPEARTVQRWLQVQERALRTVVVAAVIERGDRRLLIGQRRNSDTSPLKWEFPGGKMEKGESPEEALARELREELGATLVKSREIARVRHAYAATALELEIRFFAAQIASDDVAAKEFERITWVLPRELTRYDFLAANGRLVADLATGRIRVGEILETQGAESREQF